MGCLKLSYYPTTELKIISDRKVLTYNKTEINNRSSYLYGFNGKEKDPEGLGGSGTTYDYGFRIYNPNLGRFLSVDPLSKSYPWYTPYQFAGNTPIVAIDLDGLEELIIHYKTFTNSQGDPVLYNVFFRYLIPGERKNKTPSTYVIDNATDPSTLMNSKKFTNRYNERNVQTYDSNSDGIGNQAFAEASKNFLRNNTILQTRIYSGATFIRREASIHFGDDAGRNPNEVKTALNREKQGVKNGLDDIVRLLIQDGSVSVSVVGVASPVATSIKGEKTEVTVENNVELAQKRADATKQFIVNYAMEKYNVVIDEARITTSSKVSNVDSENKNYEDRKVTITTNQ